MYYAHLTRRARYQIEQLIQEAIPVALIARELNVHRSSIYRERKPSYHGIGWQRINPRLRAWWGSVKGGTRT